MFRFRSALKFAAPLAVLLATTAMTVTLTSTSVRADYYDEHGWHDYGSHEDGSAKLWFKEDTGSWAVVIGMNVYMDDAVCAAIVEKLGYNKGNPNPDDPTGGKGTEAPSADAIKKLLKDAAAVLHNSPINSKVGGIIEQNGGGKAPHWNPGDGDDNGPSDLPSSKDKKDAAAELKAKIAAQLEKAAKQAALGKQGMYDEGAGESWGGFNVHSKKNDPSASNGDKDNGDHSPDKPDVPKGEDLGQKPELVNPNPEMMPGTGGKSAGKGKSHNTVSVEDPNLKTGGAGGKGKSNGFVAVKTVKSGKTGGNKTDGNGARSNVMSQGLLDGANGFGSNGPAGMGGMGGGHTTRLR